MPRRTLRRGFLLLVTGSVTKNIKIFIGNIAQKFCFGQDNARFVDITVLTNGYKIVILAKSSVNIQPYLFKENRL